MKCLAILSVLAASPALAQPAPVAEPEDMRIARAQPVPGASIPLAIRLGSDATLLFPPGEALTTVTIAASEGWQVIQDDTLGRITLRPARPLPGTTMTVVTARHSYTFELSVGFEEASPIIVRIADQNDRPRRTVSAPPQDESEASWRLSGNKQLWPVQVRDDGARTYLHWSADQPMPAVFALDRLGREEMVDGYMRADIFVIDRVYDQLLFRIDKAIARARRSEAGRKR